MWFDGANGGDGFYGGARETRRIDNTTYYDWVNTWKIVRELQPAAAIFSDGGPDVRWVGNESGFAGDPCWATLNAKGAFPGHAEGRDLTHGERNGTAWLPAEVDVSIRPGWFYHASEDDKVKSLNKLTQIYLESVGRGANLILNIPPDRRGQIPDADAKVLWEWGALLKATFAADLSRGAKATSDNTRGGDKHFAPSRVLDAKPETYWTTDDAALTPQLMIEWRQPITFNVVRLREFLPLGQRVDAFALDAWQDEKWTEFATGTSIGNTRLVATSKITTAKVRLRITQAGACPALSEVGFFAMPLANLPALKSAP